MRSMTTPDTGKAARMEVTAQLLKQGLTNQQIAKQLGVHETTVRNYVAQMDGRATKESRAADRRMRREQVSMC